MGPTPGWQRSMKCSGMRRCLCSKSASSQRSGCVTPKARFLAKLATNRREGGVARAARELPVPGKTPEARRQFIKRALKIDGIWSDAKLAARSAGLDDNQKALLDIAGEHSQETQVAKVHEIADRKATARQRKDTPATKISADSVYGDETDNDAASDVLSIEDETSLSMMRDAWMGQCCLKRSDWEAAPCAVQRHFVRDVLLATTKS
jgi:hypothetical protein